MSDKMREAIQEAVSVLQTLITPENHGVPSETIYFQAVSAESKLRALLSSVTLSEEDLGCPPNPAGSRERSIASQASQTVALPTVDELSTVVCEARNGWYNGDIDDQIAEAVHRFLAAQPTPGALTAQAEGRSEVTKETIVYEPYPGAFDDILDPAPTPVTEG